LQEAGAGLQEIVLRNPPHQVLPLLHEDEDRGCANDKRGNERYALGAGRHGADAAPPSDEAAEFGAGPRRDSASAQLERDGALVVGISVQIVVGESDECSGAIEGPGAPCPDRKGLPEIALDLRHQAEPRLIRRAWRELQRVGKEIAIAVRPATYEAVRP
jgi:hypothetical protein